MLCMVVRDVYSQGDAKSVEAALRDLFKGSWSWHEAGLYAFWDPDTREILYIGLDRRLARRFHAHNSRVQKRRTGDQRVQVSRWFGSRATLGYSVVVQSREARVLENLGIYSEATLEVIRNGEGQLLQTHRLRHGGLPRWNSVGGAGYGNSLARDRPSMLDLLAGPLDSLLVARRTIRQLADDDVAGSYEHNLHVARMYAFVEASLGGDRMLGDGEIWGWLRRIADSPDEYGVLADDFASLMLSGYLEEPAPFSELL